MLIYLPCFPEFVLSLRSLSNSLGTSLTCLRCVVFLAAHTLSISVYSGYHTSSEAAEVSSNIQLVSLVVWNCCIRFTK